MGSHARWLGWGTYLAVHGSGGDFAQCLTSGSALERVGGVLFGSKAGWSSYPCIFGRLTRVPSNGVFVSFDSLGEASSLR